MTAAPEAIDPAPPDAACEFCARGITDPCPKTRRRCGHHNETSWDHSECSWCGKTWEPDDAVEGEASTATALCPSTIHDEDGETAPSAEISGSFTTPWWEREGRAPERTTMCRRCARALVVGGYLTADDPAFTAEVEAWVVEMETKPTRDSQTDAGRRA